MYTLLALLLASVSPNTLAVTYLLDDDGDGICEKVVCEEVGDERARFFDLGLSHAYTPDQMPCREITYGKRWCVHYHGGVTPYDGTGENIGWTTDIVADVNDGMRLKMTDLATGNEVCGINFWGDVPAGWNYHSTDAMDITNVCAWPLHNNRMYLFDVEFYHQPSPDSRYYHNRAYMDLWFKGLRAHGVKLAWSVVPDEMIPTIRVDRLTLQRRQHGDVTRVRVRANLEATGDIDWDDFEGALELWLTR